MYRIMYLSTATVRFSDEELEQLLEVARKNNGEKNVTGLLIMKGRSFLQCLEGEKNDVLEIFGKIEKDERHDSIVQVVEEDETNRYFPKWFMGYKNINHLDAIESKKLINFSQEKNVQAFKKDDIADIFKEFIEEN